MVICIQELDILIKMSKQRCVIQSGAVKWEYLLLPVISSGTHLSQNVSILNANLFCDLYWP